MTAVADPTAIGHSLWNRRIPMRDGVEVAADVVLPEGDGPWPAVVNRTPYIRGEIFKRAEWRPLVERGYAFVTVDVRGRGDSQGSFTPFVHDADDGHDVIEWVAAQPWCTGKVGMLGSSYEGLTQWWSAKGKPPHLACVVPLAVGAASAGPRWNRDTGAPLQYWYWWFNMVTGRTLQNPTAPSWGANYGHRPLRTLHERVGTARELWPKLIDKTIEYLGPSHVLSAEDWAAFDVPALVGVGWWDDQSTMTTWMALKDSPAGPRSHLLIGAWDHVGNLEPRSELGGFDVSASAIDVIAYAESFLAFHLKGEPAELPRCRVFRTGLMRWETPEDWPSPDAEPASWHLRAGGGLSRDAGPDEGEDSYLYDPANPAPDFSDIDAFAWSDPPLDARYRLRREDVLVFTGDELQAQVDVSGQAIFEGVVSVDAPDADLVVTIHDVHPDGRSIELVGILPGIQRLAHRNGEVAEPLTPGRPVEVRVPIVWMHHSFLPGHRIRLTVTSSAFPFNALNFNGGEPWEDAVEPRVARVTLHSGPESRSRLVLPVEPAGDAR